MIVASACRRRIWVDHPHGATVHTTGALVVAGLLDLVLRGGGVISVLVTGPQMLLVASAISAAATVYTSLHADAHVPILG